MFSLSIGKPKPATEYLRKPVAQGTLDMWALRADDLKDFLDDSHDVNGYVFLDADDAEKIKAFLYGVAGYTWDKDVPSRTELMEIVL